jgi:hypothetical protein
MRPNTKPNANIAKIVISSNTSGIIGAFPPGPPACYAKVSKSLRQPACLGIRHSLAASTTVAFKSLFESPTSSITGLLPVTREVVGGVVARLGLLD